MPIRERICPFTHNKCLANCQPDGSCFIESETYGIAWDLYNGITQATSSVDDYRNEKLTDRNHRLLTNVLLSAVIKNVRERFGK